jgi:hypothetical protein
VDAFTVRKLSTIAVFECTERYGWGVYERCNGKLKLVSRHEKRQEARDARDELMKEERRHGSPD